MCFSTDYGLVKKYSKLLLRYHHFSKFYHYLLGLFFEQMFPYLKEKVLLLSKSFCCQKCSLHLGYCNILYLIFLVVRHSNFTFCIIPFVFVSFIFKIFNAKPSSTYCCFWKGYVHIWQMIVPEILLFGWGIMNYSFLDTCQ